MSVTPSEDDEGMSGLRNQIKAAIALYQGIAGLGPDWVDDGEEPGLIADLVMERVTCFTTDEAAELRGMVEEWISEGFTTPPYTAEQYAIFARLGIAENYNYDLTPPAPNDKPSRMGRWDTT